MTNGIAVKVSGLCRRYGEGNAAVSVLDQVDLELAPGDVLAIVGPSGCGKSTLMHQLGLLDAPTAGSITFDGRDVSRLDDAARSEIRNRRVGYVFQAHHLLREHDALGNVMLPVRLAGGSQATARTRAEALLGAVGLEHRLHHKPGELSGGEQQRVALARALVMGPGLVLADEPTGNLDPRTAADVFALLLDLHDQLGSTLVVVTHSHELAARCGRKLTLRDGRLVEVVRVG